MTQRFASFRAQLGLIAAAGLVLRVLNVVLLVADEPHTPSDRFYYNVAANLLADGQGFVEPFRLEFLGEPEPTAGHPPLWPFVLAVSSLLGGTTWTAHRLVGCLLGAATIVVVGLLGRRVGGPRIGLLSAGIAAAYPTLIAADGSLLSETLYGLVVALALLAAYRLHDRPEVRPAAVLGALVALATLARGEGLLLLVLLAVPLCLRRRPWRWEGLRLVGAAVLGCVVVLAPWTVRNIATFGELIPVSLNDSTVLAGANCAQTYEGENIGGWQLTCLSRRRLELNEVEQARIWREEGLDYAREHTGDLPKVIAVRVLRTWDLYQPVRQAESSEGRDPNVQQAGTIVYFLLAALAIYGAILVRRRGGPLLILLAPAVAVTVASVVGYGFARLRHPVEISLVVLSGVAVADILARQGVRWAATSPRRPPARKAA